MNTNTTIASDKPLFSQVSNDAQTSASDKSIIHSTSTNHEIIHNWIELSASAMQHNALQIQSWLGKQTKISAVIKANAYGHGISAMASMYESCDAIANVCVMNVSEAILVRESGMNKDIIVIGYLDMNYDVIVQYDLQVVVYDFQIACALQETARRHKKQIKVHIKFDTGMYRLGILEHEIAEFIEKIKSLSWLSIQGIFSHLAESYTSARTHAQEQVFQKNVPAEFTTHISNSHGALTTKYNNYSFARIGISLYGYAQRYSHQIQESLQPVMSIKTKILQIKFVPAGCFVGYESVYQAPQDITVAILPMGYYEGLDARLSNLGAVIINDQYAPIVGRVCMNLTIVNISNIENCIVGQTVTVLGKEKIASISVYDWSALTKASVYNHLTKLSPSLTKIIVP